MEHNQIVMRQDFFNLEDPVMGDSLCMTQIMTQIMKLHLCSVKIIKSFLCLCKVSGVLAR